MGEHFYCGLPPPPPSGAPPPYDGGGMKSGAPSQHRGEAGHRLAGGLLVVHQGDADVALGGVDALGLAANVGAGQHLEVRLAPQPARGILAVAAVEPQEEAAARREVAEAVVQDLFGDAEVLAV